MAINFGNKGTVTLGGGARLVCTPESQIASSGGGGTWTLTFTGGQCGLINCTTDTQTIPETVTLYFERITTAGGATISFYKNNTFVVFMDSSFDTTTLSFNANDTLGFSFSGIYGEGTLVIRQDNASGRLISNVPFFVQDF